VREPQDLRGMRIRVQQSETAIAMVKLLDATPVVVHRPSCGIG
jgi:TRAP-type C4-dicarboxylate transport system substrate-binding protein